MVNASYMEERTPAHEIGHATFKLYHPDGSQCNDIDDQGWKKDKLEKPYINDKYNFMNSGCLYESKTVNKMNEFRIRKYQWKYIRDGK